MKPSAILKKLSLSTIQSVSQSVVLIVVVKHISTNTTVIISSNITSSRSLMKNWSPRKVGAVTYSRLARGTNVQVWYTVTQVYWYQVPGYCTLMGGDPARARAPACIITRAPPRFHATGTVQVLFVRYSYSRLRYSTCTLYQVLFSRQSAVSNFQFTHGRKSVRDAHRPPPAAMRTEERERKRVVGSSSSSTVTVVCMYLYKQVRVAVFILPWLRQRLS